MGENVKLFDLETKEKFTRELKKSIFENKVEIKYIVNTLKKYDIDLTDVLEIYFKRDFGSNFEKEIFFFGIDENGEEKLKIVLEYDYDEMIIETGNKNEILEILEEFVDACEEGYELHKGGADGLSKFFKS